MTTIKSALAKLERESTAKLQQQNPALRMAGYADH